MDANESNDQVVKPNLSILMGLFILYAVAAKLLFASFQYSIFFFSLLPLSYSLFFGRLAFSFFALAGVVLFNLFILQQGGSGTRNELFHQLPFILLSLITLFSIEKLITAAVKHKGTISDLEKERIRNQEELSDRISREKELEEKLKYFSSLVENVNEVVFELDNDLLWKVVNPAWTTFSGFSEFETLGTSFTKYLPQNEQEKVKAFFTQKLKRTTANTVLKTQIITKNDEKKWVEIHCKELQDEEFTVSGITGTIRDITEGRVTEETLNLRARFEKLLATISTAFINLPPNKIDQAIIAALKVIGMFFSLDRSYLFIYSEEQNLFLKSHEWRAQGITKPIMKTQKRSSKPFAYLEKKLNAFETIYFPDVSQIPDAAASVKRILERVNIKSILILPLTFSNELLGFMCFDAIKQKKELSPESLQLLQVIPGIFTNALQSKKRSEEILSLNRSLEERVALRTEELETANKELKNEIDERKKIQNALKESETRYKELFDSNPYPLWVYDQDTLKFLTVNDMAVKHYGYSREEFLNMSIVDIRPSSDSHAAAEYFKSTLPEIDFAGIWKHLKKDGTYLDVEKISHAITYDGKRARLVLALDVTDRIKAEKELQASLNEKELMLKEIHHRVKNNLQIISSLLTLQSESLKDQTAKEYFADSQNRIKSMAIIHEKLYQTRDFANIDIKEYVNNLVLSLFRAYNITSSQIEVEVDITNISLDVDTAIPCGLIINELVSNSLKYAFPAKEKGKMSITLKALDDEKLQLTVSDNGPGLPQNFEPSKAKSLGLTLVTILTNQLNGEIKMLNDSGTTFIITFMKRIQGKSASDF